ncbi:MAG: hypothetical protein HY602_00210 [Parcubacteria group bacterium]|nr:hypothetical protein [Parcubacteria group bacterium]
MASTPQQTENVEISVVRFYSMPAKFFSAEEKKGGKIWLWAGLGAVLLLVGGGAVYFLLQTPPEKPQVVVETPPAQPASAPQEDAPKAAEPLPEEAKQEEPAAPQEPSFAVEYVSSLDTDQDGLTDVEEGLYSTFVSRPDSDGDGHIDSEELLNFYNPIGLAPADLSESGLVKSFENQKGNYSFLYPSAWQAGGKDLGAEVSAPAGDSFEVSVENNPGRKTISEWYLEKNPTVQPTDIQTFTTKTGLRGLKTKDGLTVYFVKIESEAITAPPEELLVYGWKYKPAKGSNELHYRTTFEMIYTSYAFSD